MGKISTMSTKLANMIAAGEVVERPANIVKELVENSIDANSNNISIYLNSGGLLGIKITDDGEGMDLDDIKLCFLPHATSKIKNEYDLFRIRTLGFRGEALASICSVSSVSLTSKTKDGEAYNICYKFGRQVSLEKTSSANGTTIVVKDLFLNTPARLKYLKTKEQELGVISTLVDKLALSNPQISFSLYNDDKLIYKSQGKGNLVALVGSIYGLEAAKRLKHLSFKESGFSGEIYYVKPEIYRANKNQLTYIINGRYVRYYALNDVIVEAFKGYLPINKYPILILYLTIDPLLIDVNIHPKKEEIKIAEPRVLFDIIYNKIKDDLKGINEISKAVIDKEVVPKEINNKEEIKYFKEDIKPLTPLFNKEDSLIVNKQKLPTLNFIGIYLKTYILCEAEEKLYLLDQHACAERIRYEFYARELGNPKKITQALLVPYLISFTKEEINLIKLNMNIFSDLGFKFKINDLDIEVLETPVWAQKELSDIIIEIVKLISEDKKINIIDFRDRICKQISCKSSIRAKDSINKEEALALIKELEKCENPYHCPHGRPTIVVFSKNDLEKMFARVI